jgi:hypothetical protein
MVMCDWSYDWENGTKELIRGDTGEIVQKDSIREHEQQRHFDELKREQEEKVAEDLSGGESPNSGQDDGGDGIPPDETPEELREA